MFQFKFYFVLRDISVLEIMFEILVLQRQLLTLEEKLYKIDQRRAKAYYIVKGAC